MMSMLNPVGVSIVLFVVGIAALVLMFLIKSQKLLWLRDICPIISWLCLTLLLPLSFKGVQGEGEMFAWIKFGVEFLDWASGLLAVVGAVFTGIFFWWSLDDTRKFGWEGPGQAGAAGSAPRQPVWAIAMALLTLLLLYIGAVRLQGKFEGPAYLRILMELKSVNGVTVEKNPFQIIIDGKALDSADRDYWLKETDDELGRKGFWWEEWEVTEVKQIMIHGKDLGLIIVTVETKGEGTRNVPFNLNMSDEDKEKKAKELALGVKLLAPNTGSATSTPGISSVTRLPKLTTVPRVK